MDKPNKERNKQQDATSGREPQQESDVRPDEELEDQDTESDLEEDEEEDLGVRKSPRPKSGRQNRSGAEDEDDANDNPRKWEAA